MHTFKESGAGDSSMSDKSIRAVGVVTVKDVAAFMPHMEAVTKETRKYQDVFRNDPS